MTSPLLDNALDRLTSREVEVLRLMSLGMSNRAICDQLFLSKRTVETHVRTIYTKLDLPPEDLDAHRRVRAVLAYVELGAPASPRRALTLAA